MTPDPQTAHLLDKLSPEGIVALLLVYAGLTFSLRIVGMWLDRRDRGKVAQAAAASCNYPTELVTPMRDAVARQSLLAEQQTEALDSLREAIASVVASSQRANEAIVQQMQRHSEALTANTVELVKALAELRAGHRGNGVTRGGRS